MPIGSVRVYKLNLMTEGRSTQIGLWIFSLLAVTMLILFLQVVFGALL